MALQQKRKRPLIEAAPPQHKKSDVVALVQHIRSNAVAWGVGALVVLLALLAAFLYSVMRKDRARDVNTEYAKTLENEDPAARLAALEKVDAEGTERAAEVQYMIGETAYEAGETEKAKAAFEAVRDKYSDSEFVAPALEGLGNILEDAGKLEEALAQYQQVLTEYPESFAAERQRINIGRVQERLDRIREAVVAYNDAVTLVGQQPSVATAAQEALARLRESHPDIVAEVTGATEVTPEAAPAPAAAAETGLAVQPITLTPPPSTPATPPDAGQVNVTEEPAAPAEGAPAAEAPDAPAETTAPAEASPAAETPTTELPAEAPRAEEPAAETPATEAPAAPEGAEAPAEEAAPPAG
jgi:tetratricopeptide (TPR) repeat protein